MKEWFKKLNKLNPMRILFSDNQRSILKECKQANSEDNHQWFTKNVALPLGIILFPLFIQIIFPTDVKDFKTIIFNGSISLIGINILFGMSAYLIKVSRIEKNKVKDAQSQQDDYIEKGNSKLNQDVIHLRSRLDDYKNILVFIGGSFYVIQALYGKYNSELMFYIFLACTIFVLFLSIKIGKYMFIIKDDFFERTFYSEMNDPIGEARNRWSKKY